MTLPTLVSIALCGSLYASVTPDGDLECGAPVEASPWTDKARKLSEMHDCPPGAVRYDASARRKLDACEY